MAGRKSENVGDINHIIYIVNTYKRKPVMNDKVLSRLGEQHDFVQSFYEFHPEAFEDLSDEERQLLHDVYFLDRKIDVESVDEHIKQYVEQDPNIVTQLNNIIGKVADKTGLNDEMKEDLLLSSEE